MSRHQKRSQSSNDPKRNWLKYLFGGFKSSQKTRKRGKSERSVQSQTETNGVAYSKESGTQYFSNYPESDTFQNCSRSSSKTFLSSKKNPQSKDIKIIRKISNVSEFEKNIQILANFFLDEFCFFFINDEVTHIRNRMLFQRIKFKHELSKLYYKIYIDDNTNGDKNPKSGNSSVVYELTIDDSVNRNLKVKSKREPIGKNGKSILKLEKDIKVKNEKVRPNTSKRYTIKKCQNKKSGIKTVSGKVKSNSVKIKNHSVKDKNNTVALKKRFSGVENNSDSSNEAYMFNMLQNHNEKSCTDDIYTMSCAVSLSSLNMSNEHILESCKEMEVEKLKIKKIKDRLDGDNIFFIDEAEDVGNSHCKQRFRSLSPKGDYSETNKTERNKKINAAQSSIISDESNFSCSKGIQKDSSIILDFEIFKFSDRNRKHSVHSDQTFSDVKTFSTHEEFSNIKGEFLKPPVFISIAWSNAQVGVPNHNSSNSLLPIKGITMNADANVNNGIDACNLNTENEFLEQFCETEKTVSTKYSGVPDQCVTMLDTLTHPFGTLCEVLSENYTTELNELYHPKRCSRLDKCKTVSQLNTNSTFWKHTISSKLKVKQ